MYEYMNTSEIINCMHPTIRNVKKELQNVKHLTGNILPRMTTASMSTGLQLG